MTLSLLVSDVAGTLVTDEGVVLAAFETALRETAPSEFETHRGRWLETALATMGQSKKEVFLQILGTEDLSSRATSRFENAYLENLDRVTPLPGVRQLLEDCRTAGIPVFLTTGFSRSTLNAVLSHLGWWDLISGSVTPEEAGAGRPSPAMILEAMRQAGVTDHSGIAVVGDTESDIRAGISASVGLVVGVLTGAHEREVLERAKADEVLDSVIELRPHLGLNPSRT